MNQKLRNNVIAIGAMVVLSIGIIAGIKYTNGDFGAKEKVVALDVSGYVNSDATITEANRCVDGSDATTGYVVTATATGFNAASPIEMKITFDAAKEKVVSFEVLSQEETPGLGANVATEEFAAQFANVAGPVYTADMTATGTAFDQISGATISSKAVAHAINAAYEYLATVE